MCDSCYLLRCFKQVSKFSYRAKACCKHSNPLERIFLRICEAKTMFIFHSISLWMRACVLCSLLTLRKSLQLLIICDVIIVKRTFFQYMAMSFSITTEVMCSCVKSYVPFFSLPLQTIKTVTTIKMFGQRNKTHRNGKSSMGNILCNKFWNKTFLVWRFQSRILDTVSICSKSNQ